MRSRLRLLRHARPSNFCAAPTHARAARAHQSRARRAGPGLAALRVALIAFGIVGPLLGLELLLRLAGPILPGDYQTASFAERSTVYGRQNRPGTAGWARASEYSTYVRVNSKGLRGPEAEYEKPPGASRILALGDSFTFGLAVAEKETFTGRLADRLNARSGGERYEVLNAGTPGWSTVNEYLWFLREGSRYEQDVMLLMFFVGNDPADNAAQLGSSDQVDRLGLIAGEDAPLNPLRRMLRDRSVAYTFFETGALVKLGRWASAGGDGRDEALAPGRREELLRRWWGGTPPADVAGLEGPREAEGWLIAEALLGRLGAATAARGTRLVVVELPTEEQVFGTAPLVTPLSAISAGLGLPHIDLGPRFRREPPKERRALFLEEDGHWSSEGHRIAARYVAAQLAEMGLIPRDASEQGG